ncbi:MAG: HAMP domain-containing sensor histidine kinase [Gemmatimonadota bacterium]
MPPDSIRDNLVPWPGTPDGSSPEESQREEGKRPGWWRSPQIDGATPEQLELASVLEDFLFSHTTSLDLSTPGLTGSLPRDLLAHMRAVVVAAHGSGASAAQADQLHRRLDELWIQLAGAALAEAMAGQHRMIEDISHDIRSPLNSILFLADALFNQRQGDLNPAQERQVSVLYSASVSLVKLVNDLIDYARMQADSPISVSLVPFSVESVLQEVNGLVGPLAQHCDIQLHTAVNTDGMRSGDPQILKRVLLNLVTNAIQASGEGGAVSVHVFERDGPALCVEVTDEGVGTDLELIRRRLTRPDENPGETRGWTHGLGLSISSRLVAAAGGSVDVRSQPGEGTVFTVVLPFPQL